MRSFLRLLGALASAIEQFVAADGVRCLVEYWKQRRSESLAAERLSHEQTLSSALARGDLDAVEHHAARLLANARRANADNRAASGGGDRPGPGHSDNHTISLVRDDADLEQMQAQIDALL